MLYSILLLAVGLNPTQNFGHEENVLEEVVVSAEKGVIVNRQDTLSTDGVLSITDLLLKSPSLNIFPAIRSSAAEEAGWLKAIW